MAFVASVVYHRPRGRACTCVRSSLNNRLPSFNEDVEERVEKAREEVGEAVGKAREEVGEAVGKAREKTGEAVGKAREAVRNFKDRYEQAKRIAAEYESSSIVVGADVELGQPVEVEDVQIPLRDNFIAANVADVAGMLEIEDLLDMREGLAKLTDWKLLRSRQKILMGMDAGNFDSRKRLYELVERAGFRHVSIAELTDWSRLERYPESIRVALQSSGADHPFEGIGDKRDTMSNVLYPDGLAFYRGVGVARASGVLLGPKLKALQSRVFGWLEEPVNFAAYKALELRALLMRTRKPDLEEQKLHLRDDQEDLLLDLPAEFESEKQSRKVRRVTVTAQWRGRIADFFLPTFTQEPTTKQLLFIYADESEAGGSQSSMPLRLQLYEEVPFAGVPAFMPKSVIIPSFLDAARLDILTIFGLIASIYAVGTSSDKSVLFAAGTFLQYVLRVIFNVRNVLQRNRISSLRLRLNSIVARGPSVLLALQDMTRDMEVKTSLLLLGGLSMEKGGEADVDQLRSRLESCIEANFEEKVSLDLAIRNVLPLLEEAGLVERTSNNLVRLTDSTARLLRTPERLA